MLLSSLLLLSGMASALTVLLPADACCAGTPVDAETDSDPCSQAECSCAFCLALDLEASVFLGAVAETDPVLTPLPYLWRYQDVAVAIDYPPETR